MKILAIETSCDETAIAVLECSGGLVRPSFKVLGNTLLSQIDIHKEYGGVYPMLAKREHQKNLPILLSEALREALLDPEHPEIDCVAVTEGPGLEPALWTGITFAEELGRKWEKPVIGVNHMEGHIVSVLYSSDPSEIREIRFPALALLVSGGHTEIVRVEGYGQYEVIGSTRDDAVGEAFDKTARLLGLPYPGGPKISILAAIDREKYSEPSIVFPRPMVRSGDLDFSFSGLKTAVLYAVRDTGDLTEEDKEHLARAFEDAAIDVLIKKFELAYERFGAETLILGGGVSANAFLRERLNETAQNFGIPLMLPNAELTGDNAIMIGTAAYIELSIHPELLVTPSAPLRARGTLSLS